MKPEIPKPFDDSFENLPTFWDVEFGFEVADDFVITETRTTVRVFCFDQDGNISAVEGKHNPGGYYIPGGGVEGDETLEQAAIREAREESGDIIANLKPIMRYLNRFPRSRKFYDIYIFTADIIEKGDPTTTQASELNKGVKYLQPKDFIKLLGDQFERDNLDSQSFVTKYALENFLLEGK
jgi:ADP-ribose pyrophosphatase YjhB (NUDIX family)